MESWVTDRRRRPRRGPRRCPRLLAASALALLCGCADQKKLTGPLLLHPVPPAAQGYALVQGATVFSGPGFTVSARPWDYRLIAEEIARSGEPNPFGKSEAATGRFLFVRVRLENRSSKSLVFNPLQATMTSEGEAPIVPVENADLVAFADQDLAGAEALARVFRRLSFDLTATVPAGGTLERYLVFPSPEKARKQIALRLGDLWLGSSSFDLIFPFESYPGAAPDPTSIERSPQRALP
ncbi:MAG TPA: hypothetical protein VN317_06090 [Candidatus Methanoperedens sp.]|nr:hypothetical protein [Candidatus Methanoperedens sp.]